MNEYPNVGAAVEGELAKIAAQVARWHTAVLDRITRNDLLSVTIDVFCIPVPSVMELRQAVRAKVGNY